MEKTGEKSTKNPILWFIRYVRESKEEVNKVTWPSKETTARYSIITIVISVITAAFFAGLDWVLKRGLEQLIMLST